MSCRVTRFDQGEPGEVRTVTRCDTYRLDKAQLLPNGALRVDALVTKSGVFTYHDEAGRPVLEYRPPEEVQQADSMKSLQDMTVTVLHPPGLVTADNWKTYAVGHVSGSPVAADQGVKTSLVIQDAAAIADIQSGKLKEISCGYTLQLEDSPGQTPSGERYDKVQRAMRYNHVAMGPEGWGRQGSSVSLRLDSRGNQVTNDVQPGAQSMKLTIIFDGQTYTVDAGSAEHNALIARIAAKDAEVKAKLDAATQTQKQVDTLTAERDVLQKKVTDLTTKLDAAPAAAVVAARARLTLEGEATRVLGESFKADGADGKPLTDRAIRLLVIQKFDPDFKADGADGKPRSDDYIESACDTHLKAGSESIQRRMVVQQQDGLPLRKDGTEKVDHEVDPDPDAARAKMKTDSRTAHKRPGAVSFLPAKA